MNLITELLEELSRTEHYYKGVRVNVLGLPKFVDRKRSVSSTLSQMKKKGLLIYIKGRWHPTSQGEMYLRTHSSLFPTFPPTQKKGSPRDLIVMFDIPEEKRILRDWLRDELKLYDYRMIQQSVWVGPSPLPKGFLAFLKEAEIKDCIKTFKLQKGYK